MNESIVGKKRRTKLRGAPTDEPIRAVAYVRLSKAKPKPGDTEVGLDTQLAGCERAISAMGGSVVAVEQDIQSGDRLDRSGLWRAIERIQAGEANALIVYSLDRLSRDGAQKGLIRYSVRHAGGRLFSATETLDEGPLGDAQDALYGFAAAAELEKIRERTSRAFNAKFRQTGAYKPSGRPPYGYRKVGSGAAATYEIEPAEAAVVRRIFTERAAGASVRRILLGLRRDGIPTPSGCGQWGTKTVDIILSREVYVTGKHECWRTQTVRDLDGIPWTEQRPREERYFASFPAFLEPALLERARATAKRNVWRSRREDRPAELGILRYGFAR